MNNGNVQSETIQKIQEDEYSFPYHYVSRFRNGFTQCFNDIWGIYYVSTIEYIINRLKIERFDSLLDIGCGDGRLVKEILEEYPGKDIVGVDYSQRAITLAKTMNPAGVYYVADITQTYLGKEFNAGILIEVFEHIPRELGDAFVRGIAKHIKKQGFLYITVPHTNKPVEYKHHRHFTVASIIQCFSTYFEVNDVIPFEKDSLFTVFIDRILTNRFFILNSGKLRKWIYKFYKENLFFSDERRCKRIFVRFVRR